MAKNVSLLGANYPDVPAVDLPQTGGGTARFTDVSDTTATAGDVLSGKTFFAGNGEEQQGSLITHNVYDGLNSDSAVDALSAKQGKVLNNNLTNKIEYVVSDLSNIDSFKTTGFYRAENGSSFLQVYNCVGQVMQIEIRPYDHLIRARYYNGSSWSNWTNIYGS